MWLFSLCTGPPQILSVPFPTAPPGEMTISTGQPTDIAINTGTTVTIYCPSSGVDHPSIVWFKDDVLILFDGRFSISMIALTGADVTGVLQINNFRPVDAGTYRCTATNLIDSANGEVTLRQR